MVLSHKIRFWGSINILEIWLVFSENWLEEALVARIYQKKWWRPYRLILGVVGALSNMTMWEKSRNGVNLFSFLDFSKIFDHFYSPMLQVWASHLGLMFVLNVLNSPRTFIKINYMYEVKGLLHKIGTRQKRWQSLPCYILRSSKMWQIFGSSYVYSASSRLPRAAHIQTIWPIKVLS